MMQAYQKAALEGQIMLDLQNSRRPEAVEIVNRENDLSISSEDYAEQISYARDRISAYMADAVKVTPEYVKFEPICKS